MEAAINTRQSVEVADILRLSQQELTSQHSLCPTQYKALEALTQCRTSQLGGHARHCTNCSHQELAYNSCRNRHCPKCQFIKQEQWVDKLQSRLIPGRYFHVVFTIPHQLNSLFYLNQQKCYNVLFSAAWEALNKAGNNTAFLGAQVGAVAVLHTWGQTLSYHPHVHMMVPAGGLSEDGVEWVQASRNFFVPVKALSKMFRGSMMRQLKELKENNELKLPDTLSNFTAFKECLYQKSWNVYCKKALGGMNGVLKYLGKYTHRVAISNNRLISIKKDKVCFRYRDYRMEDRRSQRKTMTIDVIEFARRFMQHILPCGFYKIRYYGILATANIKTKREAAIAIIGKAIWFSTLEGLTAYEVLRSLCEADPALCPACKKGIMHWGKANVQKE
jgi:hypothetical protein